MKRLKNLLSNKLKFAIKVSLSLTLAYMIPMAFAWAQPNTAAITVMLIASIGGVRESVNKGIIRIIGTLIGASIGLLLISLFPQERFIYLSVLSIIITLLVYLYYAYQGDSSVVMLTIVTMMMIFLSGPVDAFLYGLERTSMTLFGIVIYTLIGLYILPIKTKLEDTFNDEPKTDVFIWLDMENLKATFAIFCIYWFSVLFWIYFNPPGGFLVVVLATALGLLVSFSPLKPSLLMILFSMGFIFAILMYVFVLPNLVYAWQLAIFLFIYTFIGFYLINPKITVFFLLGMFTLGIANDMTYNFDVFLMILLIFYMFLMILMLFLNIPFSSKPQHLFGLMKDRFFSHSEALKELKKEELTWLREVQINYHKRHLKLSVTKLTIWGSKIDTRYFNLVSSSDIEEFCASCKLYLGYEKSLQSCYNDASKINWKSLKVSKL